MNRGIRFMIGGFAVLLALSWIPAAYAHHQPHFPVPVGEVSVVSATLPAPDNAVSGQGKMKFRVLYRSDVLPVPAVKVLEAAHGGFAVDRRAGKGETYFSLPGAGIIQISADLRSTRMLRTSAAMKDLNLHNTTIWYSENGAPHLTFPANRAGQVFTTDLNGKLLHTLSAPTGKEDFGLSAVSAYFYGKGNFAPTDVEHLDGLLYVATGYSRLDYVLTAKVMSANPLKAMWYDLAFGGKGSGPGQLGTGHGITVPPGGKRIDVADRPNAEIERYTRFGHYKSTLSLPMGSYPCDVDYLDGYGIVGCLHGPDRSKGAPIYILENDKVISTVMPKEDLGLEKFQHIHNAVLKKMGDKYYIIVQAWNPGDFAILAQVMD